MGVELPFRLAWKSCNCCTISEPSFPMVNWARILSGLLSKSLLGSGFLQKKLWLIGTKIVPFFLRVILPKRIRKRKELPMLQLKKSISRKTVTEGQRTPAKIMMVLLEQSPTSIIERVLFISTKDQTVPIAATLLVRSFLSICIIQCKRNPSFPLILQILYLIISKNQENSRTK